LHDAYSELVDSADKPDVVSVMMFVL